MRTARFNIIETNITKVKTTVNQIDDKKRAREYALHLKKPPVNIREIRHNGSDSRSIIVFYLNKCSPLLFLPAKEYILSPQFNMQP